MNKFYIPHSENLYTFQNANSELKYLITAIKLARKSLD